MTPSLQPSRSIEDRVAIVTGAASGMGAATARLFAAEGAHVLAVDRNQEGLDELVSDVGDTGRLATVVADLAEPAAATQIAAAARQAFGPVDIVVNAAGVSAPVSLGDEHFADMWRQTFAVNVDAQVLLIAAVLDDLMASDCARVVNIASTEGLAATAPMAPYTASKHAVVGLTKSLAVELGKHGVNVNCICPGPIDTAMTAEIPDEHKQVYARRRTALRRYGDPAEVAHMILSLVLPAASFTTGAILTVDGGLSIRSN